MAGLTAPSRRADAAGPLLCARCALLVHGGGGADAPLVWALDTGLPGHPPEQSPEATRAAARRLARHALAQLLAPLLHATPADLAITDQRGQPPRPLWRGAGAAPARWAGAHLSIAHAPGLSLLGCHWQTPLGVDAQVWPSDADAAELVRTARCFLAPDQADVLADQAPGASFFEAFSIQWATHEARLKAAGQPLAEWSPALAARLSVRHVAPLALPDWPACRQVAAAAAWG